MESINQSNFGINASKYIPYSDAEANTRIITYLILMILAIIGNTIVILSFIKVPSMRKPFNLFILNLAVVDLLIAVFRMGFNTISIATIRGSVWPYSPNLCQFNGWVQSITFSANIHTLSMMAILRYIVVVHKDSYNISKRTVLIIIICIWLYANIVALLPILGWNHYVYQPGEIACLPDWKKEIDFPIFIIAADVLAPLLALGYSYIAIYITIKRNGRRILGMSDQSANTVALEQISRREARVSRAMFLVFLTFLICIGPYSIGIIFLYSVFKIWVGRDIAFILGSILNANSTVNPILYAFLYQRFRRAYYRVCSLYWNKVTFLWSSLPILRYNPIHNIKMVQEIENKPVKSRASDLVVMG